MDIVQKYFMFTFRFKTVRNEFVFIRRIYIEQKIYYMIVQGAETAEFVGFMSSLMPLLTKQRCELEPTSCFSCRV